MKPIKFSFEDLAVWQKSIDFARVVLEITKEIKTRSKHYRLIEQLESASTSIALNIAEGKGRYSKKEFIKFLYISRGSLYETIALLEILSKIDLIDNRQLQDLRNRTDEIAKMLSGLINSIKRSINLDAMSSELRAMS
jgi:four helix bundle protein